MHLGTHVDETGSLSTWHINKAHYLESWSDARAYDGTISIIQPMIAPMYGGNSAHEVLQTLLDNPQASPYDVVVANAKTYIKGDFATAGARRCTMDGWMGRRLLRVSEPEGWRCAGRGGSQRRDRDLFKPDPSLYDGRYANVGWLQELPKQVTNLSWDNAALMSLATAEALGVEQNDAVEIAVNGRKLIAGALMVPGHADGAVTVHLGLGRGSRQDVWAAEWGSMRTICGRRMRRMLRAGR